MKNNIFKALFFAVIVLSFVSCKKDENRVIFEGGNSPALTATPLSNPVLNLSAKADHALTFNWTNPDFKFNTGVSSQNVTYTLQIDTTGANFKSPNLKESVIVSDLSLSLTVGELNNFLAAWQENVAHNFEFRVKASLGNSVPVYSNIIKMVITPYLEVAVVLPFTNNLYIIGNATPGGDATGWNNPVPAPSQKFTKTSSTTFEITINLFGGKEFLIIPDNGSWANKYAVSASAVSWEGGPFGYNFGDNFPGPPTSGTYKVEMNFKTGKYKVTKL